MFGGSAMNLQADHSANEKLGKDSTQAVMSALGSLFGKKESPAPIAVAPSPNNEAAQRMYLMQMQQMQDKEQRRNEDKKKSNNTAIYIGVGVLGLLMIAGITIAIVKK